MRKYICSELAGGPDYILVSRTRRDDRRLWRGLLCRPTSVRMAAELAAATEWGLPPNEADSQIWNAAGARLVPDFDRPRTPEAFESLPTLTRFEGRS